MPFGFTWGGLAVLVVLAFLICVTVNSLAMEAPVLFTPAFLFVFPVIVPGFPDDLGINGAIGLAFVTFEAHHLGREVVFRLRGLVPGGLADGAVAHDYESRTRLGDVASDGGF